MSADKRDDELPWINPVGGMGDMLMVGGVLMLVAERDPERRFNLVRRTNYVRMFEGHPAIATIGFPRRGATILGVDYWSKETLGPGTQRPFQVLARSFGLATPVEERLHLPGIPDDDPLLHFIPWRQTNVVIAPASDSDRKTMHPERWHHLVHLLQRDGALVMQVGRSSERHIRNAYFLLGLTTPQQLVLLLRRVDLVITSDNFVMHAAHLAGTHAVALWGATSHEVYGYPEQQHLQLPKPCGLGPYDDCIGPTRNDGGRLYNTPCPHGDKHCLDQLDPLQVYETARRMLR